MQLENRFTVPVARADALKVLLDVERIAPCMPGATLTSRDGDDFTGTVKVKVGPINLTYGGKASFLSVDEDAGVVVIEASGKETRGTGTAKAQVTCRLVDHGTSTDVEVATELNITGKPAQFGRGVMVDVGNKLIGQFADCLAGKLTDGATPIADAAPVPEPRATPKLAAVGSDEPPETPKPRPRPRKTTSSAAHATVPDTEAPSAPEPVAAAPSAPKHANPEPRRTAAEVEPINLIESAGPAIAKRLLPLIAVVVVLLALHRRRRRRQR